MTPPERRLGPTRSDSIAAFVLTMMSVTFLTVACEPKVDENGERILDTVEVEAGTTAAIGHEEDEKAARRDLRGEQQLAGVLPGGFPQELPLPMPASVVDYGEENERPGVARWLELSVPRPVAEVRSFVDRRWPSAGWTRVDEGWERAERRVEVVQIERGSRDGESRLRIAYR